MELIGNIIVEEKLLKNMCQFGHNSCSDFLFILAKTLKNAYFSGKTM